MLRIVLVTGLLGSLLLLARGIAVTLQEETVPAPPVVERQATVAAGKPGFSFYPPVPVVLPDLNQGYIFSQSRKIADEPEADQREAETGIGIAEVSYIGSVISSERRIGIITHPEPATDLRRVSRPARSGSRQTAGKHVHLAPGETFNGYLVAEILPDRMVFEKDGTRIEKSLLSNEQSSPASRLEAGGRRQERPPGGAIRPGRFDRRPVETSNQRGNT